MKVSISKLTLLSLGFVGLVQNKALAANYTGTSATPASLVTGAQLPLRTSGSLIVDAQGDKVKLACTNWYGSHMENYAPNGLHKRPLREIVEHIAALGFNCVRLPLSVEMIINDPIVPTEALVANPDLVGLSALAINDILINEFETAGLMVVLNIHTQAASWCCKTDDINGLWNTPDWPTDKWVQSIAESTARYANKSNVVAYDIKNELHDYDGTILDWGKTGDRLATKIRTGR